MSGFWRKLRILPITTVVVLVSIASCFTSFGTSKAWPKDWPVQGLDLPKDSQIVEASKGPFTETWFIMFNSSLSHQQIYSHFTEELDSLGFKLFATLGDDYYYCFVDSSDTIQVTYKAWPNNSVSVLGYQYELSASISTSPLGLYDQSTDIQ